MNQPQISQGRATVAPEYLMDAPTRTWEIHVKSSTPRPTVHLYVDHFQVTAQKEQGAQDWTLVSVREFTDRRPRLGLSMTAMPWQVSFALTAVLEQVQEQESTDSRLLQYT
ncbi:hypothetical protein OG730_05005 [Streptomyces sp. NBC_01298]|uniref:hypothetical protein n=1 Tax=Streptomyces sp. NBC_01298 TaxID=2903817 RepID=UPI002E0E9496|nr:hypothetical protein OG730_05005 [Streptomyces sp. NBC_01298]